MEGNKTDETKQGILKERRDAPPYYFDKKWQEKKRAAKRKLGVSVNFKNESAGGVTKET